MDWGIYYQTNKGRLLAMGCILIVLGLVLYFARGIEATLVLPIVGIVLLIAGVIYKPRQKIPENLTSVYPKHDLDRWMSALPLVYFFLFFDSISRIGIFFKLDAISSALKFRRVILQAPSIFAPFIQKLQSAYYSLASHETLYAINEEEKFMLGFESEAV